MSAAILREFSLTLVLEVVYQLLPSSKPGWTRSQFAVHESDHSVPVMSLNIQSTRVKQGSLGYKNQASN